MSLVVQARACSAYLLTDTATFDARGRITGFWPKVTGIETDDGFAAYAVSGNGYAARYLEGLIANRPASSLASFLDQFPDAFRQMHQHMIGIDVGKLSRSIAIVMATFDKAARRSGGYAIGNDNAAFPLGEYQPFKLQPMRKFLTRYAGRPFGLDVDICQPKQWNPMKDAARLIEAQRIDLSGQPADEYSVIGGQAVLTRVSAEGIEHLSLKTWPDTVGKRVDLSFGREARWVHRWRGRLRERIRPPALLRLK